MGGDAQAGGPRVLRLAYRFGAVELDGLRARGRRASDASGNLRRGGSDHFVPIAWEDAFARIGRELRKLPNPNMAEFYTSGRTSNEAAFMYQVFVREFGTNNFPDCSNMCHEATSVGLPDSIGVGKGPVTLEDFDHADLVFCMGHNPGTNHPRMLSTLRECREARRHHRGVQPAEGAWLERFLSPQHPVEMLTGGAQPRSPPSTTRCASAATLR